MRCLSSRQNRQVESSRGGHLLEDVESKQDHLSCRRRGYSLLLPAGCLIHSSSTPPPRCQRLDLSWRHLLHHVTLNSDQGGENQTKILQRRGSTEIWIWYRLQVLCFLQLQLLCEGTHVTSSCRTFFAPNQSGEKKKSITN